MILNLFPNSTHLGIRYNLIHDCGLPLCGVRKAGKVWKTEPEFGERKTLIKLPGTFGENGTTEIRVTRVE